ncbi:MAG: hypothetical protein HEP71_05640 [Roseivirga sp.]|nr:hypothetical protein [Roseivirga sp.]
MKVRLIFLLAAFSMIMASADAQVYLTLRKKGSTRKYQYFKGNKITYKMEGYDRFFTDRITDFADSTIILENNIILIDQLYEVDVRNAASNRPAIWNAGETALPTIGIGLLALDIFNHSVIDRNEFSLDRGVTTTSAVLVTTGYALRIMRRKFIKLHNPKFEAYIVGL